MNINFFKKRPSNKSNEMEDIDVKIKKIWEEIQSIRGPFRSNDDLQKRIKLLSTLLEIIDQGKEKYDKGAIYRTRAMTYASLKEYDLSLSDLNHELEITSDLNLMQECKNQIERIRMYKVETSNNIKS